MDKIINYRRIKYRVFPNEKQQNQIAQTFGCVRLVYNMALELQQGLYESGMKAMSYFELVRYCQKIWKVEYPYLNDVDKFSLENSIQNLIRAYKNFFEKKSKYPKYKSKKEHYQSYTTSISYKNIEIKDNKIKIPKIGWVEANIHRKPNKDWSIKRATVLCNPSGNYFISILFEYEIEKVSKVIPTIEKSIGLDYSSPHFYVASNGEIADAPHWYYKVEKKLSKEQHKLSRMVKGSNNYEKQRRVIAKICEHIANQRKDFCHKQSRKIANFYDVVCVEDINLQGLAQSLNFGKRTNDNGFGMFRTFLKYKMEQAGKYYVVIDKWFPSSKMCHKCGTINHNLKLGETSWVCEVCGKVIDRDKNASLNIRDDGFRQLIELLGTAGLAYSTTV